MTVLSTKGQLVIPEEIRKKMDIKPGTEFYVNSLDDANILITKKPEDPIEALCGLTRGMFDEDAVTMIRRMRDEDIKKDKRKPWLA
jgi:AbrB family looped-hinge helix DNA binding protein